MAMGFETVFFFISTGVTCFICITLAKLRFGYIQAPRMKSFVPLCFASMGWIMMNAATCIAAPSAFAAVYTARMAFACTVPCLSCWFFLNFSESRLAQSRPLRNALIAFCSADMLALLTNPLHRMYFVTYDSPFPERGIIAAFHVATLSLAMLLAYAALFPYIAKNLRRYPLLLLTGFGALVPYALYMLYALQILDSRYDLSPLGFFFSVFLFAFFSYASKMASSPQDAFNETLKGIAKSPALASGNVDDAARMLAERGCRALYSSRVGIWRLDAANAGEATGAALKNISTYSLSDNAHSVSPDLGVSGDRRVYLDVLASERLIAIDDISQPNALSDMMGEHRPQIRATLDAPIRVAGRVAGVVSVEQDACEAYPERRAWTAEERSFVSSLADLMGIAMISGEQRALALRNEELMANMPGAIYQCRNDPPKYTISYISPGILGLTGHAAQEFIGSGMSMISSLIHPDDAEQSVRKRNATLIKGQPMECSFRIMRNGEERWIWERSKTAKQAPDGQPQLFEGFFADITEQRRREAAESASEAKSAFLAAMSHEMRTPLSAVISLSELTLENGGLSPENEGYLDRIYSAGTTLLTIVNDILDISKIEAGKFEISEHEYDAPSIVNDAITQNIMRLHSKPVSFSLDVGEGFPARLRGDDVRVKQILSNLLSNAFKYTDAGAVELAVECERAGDAAWVTFRVRDTGIGIRPEDMGSLFTDYKRFDGEANRKIGGTGLGLSITKRLAELMDGHVDVESEYGKGSAFTVRIRQGVSGDAVIGKETAERLRNFRYADGKRRAGSRLNRVWLPTARALVVDDNVTNLDIARGLMRPYGMKVDCVTSGQAAIDAIRREKRRYSAIFMDHMMPEMDGMEATRIIREEIGTEYAKTIPIIALTANAVAGSRERFISKGFDAFVSKPIDIFRLDAAIRKWIWRDGAAENGGATGDAASGRNGGSAASDGNSGGNDAGSITGGAETGMCGSAAAFGVARGASNGQPGKQDAAALSRQEEHSGRQAAALSRQAGPSATAIDGLDMAKGEELFGGIDPYRELLRSFALNTRPLLEQIARACENENEDARANAGEIEDERTRAECLRQYAIIVHGIKSSSRGVCAYALGDMAESLERAAKDGDSEHVCASNAGFIATARKLIGDIEAILGASGSASALAKPQKDAPAPTELDRLREACEGYDMDEMEAAMRDIDRFDYTGEDGLVEWLRDAVARLNYGGIVERIEKL